MAATTVLLAELVIAGATGTVLLADRWADAAGSVVTIQVPATDGSGDAVATLLNHDARFASIERLDPRHLANLVDRLLQQRDRASDDAASTFLPTVFLCRLRPGAHLDPDLEDRLRTTAPGSTVEAAASRMARLFPLMHDLRLCASATVLIVVLATIAAVAAATRASIERRYPEVEIMHELGADAGMLAGRCARRAMRLVFFGGSAGIVFSLPLLLLLSRLATPFAAGDAGYVPFSVTPQVLYDAALALPAPIWLGLPVLLIGVAVIGWGTAHVAVRTWLRRLP